MTDVSKLQRTANAEFYDNTMLGAYKECPRRYFFRHTLGWRSEGLSPALAFGLAWHNGQDYLWQHAQKEDKGTLLQIAHAGFMETWVEQGMPEQPSLEDMERLAPRTPGVAAEMYAHYINARWTFLQEAELIAIEQPFAVPLPNTEEVWYIGRLDKVVQHQEKMVIEHKTTTEYKRDGGFRSTYVEGWASDSQIKGYQFGAGLYFPGLRQVWVDAALVHKSVHDAFRFIPVAHQQPLLEEWLADTRSWVSRIQNEYEWLDLAGRLEPGMFPKNENACMGKYGACQFVNICRSTAGPFKHDEPPEGYIQERWQPFDLLGLDKIFDKEKLDAKR